MKQSGGHIWLYSEPGHGTAFKIYLPRVEGAPESLAALSVAGPLPSGSETILLVEDEDGLRQLTGEMLLGLGYNVLEANSGPRALEIARSHPGPIHLLLTDVVMPGMSGRELAQGLVASHPEARVLYVSGYTNEAIVHHGVLDQGVAFLQKPFTFDDLARRVRGVLDARG